MNRWRWLPRFGLLSLMVVGIGTLLDRPRSRSATRTAEWIQTGSAHIRTVRAGTGDTIVLLIHGFGESLLSWQPVFENLSREFRVVAIDVPGFGRSSKPDGSYSLDTLTATLGALVDSLGPGPVVVVGHSMGGELAAALALARPDRVIAAVLVAPAGWAIGLGGIVNSMSPLKAKILAWYLSSRSFILPEQDPGWLAEPDSVRKTTLIANPGYRKSVERVLMDFNFRGLRNRFDSITQPTLVIWGTADPVVPFALADSIGRSIPCHQIRPVARALHRPHAEVPDTVAGMIRRFIRAPTCAHTGRG